MKNVARKARAGFTLIELMVVILILGLLAAAIGVAVVGVIGGAKNKLDGERLSKFVENFNLKKEEGQNKTLIGALKDGDVARDLFVDLHHLKLITVDDMQKLAGVSGQEAASDDDYKKENKTNLTIDNVIFTSAGKGPELLQVLNGKKKTTGVSFVYNHAYLNKYPEEGTVIVFSGETHAQVLTAGAFELAFSGDDAEGGKKVTGIDFANDANIYGTYPFEHVVRE